MKVLLDKIINECELRDIHVYFDDKYCIYCIEDVDGKVMLYIEDKAIIFENKFGNKEHIISFRDVVNVLNFWTIKHEKVEFWKNKSTEWNKVFEEFIGDNSRQVGLEKDLPF